MNDDSLLTGKQLRAMMGTAALRLDSNKEAVNALNVFPVPDGDTGTNMCLTVVAAIREMDKVASSSLGETIKALSLGSLMGARGNSGVILSQLFRGMGKSLGEMRSATPLQVAWAMQEGVETAYKAVMKPVEGTMLTVSREMARAALQAARKGAGLVETLEAAQVTGREVLDRTPDMLPVLKEAGVVDAGGMGLCHLLEGALGSLRGEAVAGEAAGEARPDVRPAAAGLLSVTGPLGVAGPLSGAPSAPAGRLEEIQYAYDTQLLIRGSRLAVDRIRAQLEPLGDSLIVVGDLHLVKVHVHTNEPHRALATCLLHGEIVEASVENMREQSLAVQRARQAVASPDSARSQVSQAHLPLRPPAGQAGGASPGFGVPAGVLSLPELRAGVPVKGPGVVAVASGDGLEGIFRNLGSDIVVSGGQTMNPSTEDLLRALETLPSQEILILPNNGNIQMAAKLTIELTKKTVRVVPTKSIPQGIAALVALNRAWDAEKNLARMEQALAAVKSGEVTRAVRSSRYKDIEIKGGDFIGLVDDEIVTVGRDAPGVLCDLVKRMTGENTEIVTVFYGHDVTDKDAARAGNRLRKVAPEHEIEVHRGGQPLYHYLISVE